MPYSSLPLTIVDGRRYTGATRRAKSQMLPTDAGVYIWTLQLSQTLDGIAVGHELPQRITERFEHLRRKGFDAGAVGKYRRVHIYDDPPGLTHASENRIDGLLQSGMIDFGWLLAAGTVFQRPLYIGKAINFRTRLPAHFNYKTTFSTKIRDFGIDFNDLAVTLLRLSAEGYSPDEEGDDGEAEDEQDSANDLASELEEDFNLEPENRYEELIPPGREHQDLLIRLAESLLIRNLQPIFNEQVE